MFDFEKNWLQKMLPSCFCEFLAEQSILLPSRQRHKINGMKMPHTILSFDPDVLAAPWVCKLAGG